MKKNNDTLQFLYKKIFNIYHEWIKADSQNDPQWRVKRYRNYSFGPVIGLYLEKDKDLIDILNGTFSDEELCSLLIPIKERTLNELLSASESDLMTKFKEKSCREELSLLKDRKIDEWMDRFFIPCIKIGTFEIAEPHFRGLCYVMYGYENYQYSITNIYCGNIDFLKNLYQGVLDKNSELYTYKLIEVFLVQ
jgi:predicted CopG family antitoxin